MAVDDTSTVLAEKNVLDFGVITTDAPSSTYPCEPTPLVAANWYDEYKGWVIEIRYRPCYTLYHD